MKKLNKKLMLSDQEIRLSENITGPWFRYYEESRRIGKLARDKGLCKVCVPGLPERERNEA